MIGGICTFFVPVSLAQSSICSFVWILFWNPIKVLHTESLRREPFDPRHSEKSGPAIIPIPELEICFQCRAISPAIDRQSTEKAAMIATAGDGWGGDQPRNAGAGRRRA